MFKNPIFRIPRPLEGEQWLPLLKRNGYSDAAASSAAPKIEKMDAQLKNDLLRWDKIGDFPDKEIDGFTVAGLVENVGMHPIGAFLMMDWLLREPDAARCALAQPIAELEINQTALTRIAESEDADVPEATEDNLEQEQTNEILYHS